MFRNNKNKRKLTKLVLIPIAFASIGLTAWASTTQPESNKVIEFNVAGATPLAYMSEYNIFGTTMTTHQEAGNERILLDMDKELSDAVAAMSSECADPDKAGGLGEAQIKGLDQRRKTDMVGVNLDKIFQAGKKGGCFDALMDFPDLSVNIPTISGIFNSLKNTLLKYAVRKVCTAVNEVLEDVIGPIKEVIEKIEDDVDLSGTVNKKLGQKLGEIDPDLHRYYKPAEPEKEYEFKW